MPPSGGLPEATRSAGGVSLLRRLTKQGFLKKEGETFEVKKELPTIDFECKRNLASSDIERVYISLKNYVKEEFNQEWNDEKISDTILAFLSKFGIDYLRAYVFQTALPEIPKTAPKEQFIVSKFISNLYDQRNPLFECVSVLVKGHMYANALVCPDLESLQKKFNSLTFYMDTPLVLNLLEMQRTEETEASKELIYLIKKLKGKIAIFEHTALEIKNILNSAERNIENPNADGAVLKEIRKIGIKRSDIILIKENLEEKLAEISIRIHKTPPYKFDFQISEDELKSAIEGELSYRNPDALKFDINSIRSIYVLREGKIPKRLEDAGAVFVTQNDALAKAAFKLGQNHNSTREVSSTITDFSLANIAWLKAPLGAPDLPTKELLASCYAAMEPSRQLWHKYIYEIDNIKSRGGISADDHALLRVSPIAENELMNLTLGEENALTGDSIRAILDRVKSSLTIEKDMIISEEQSKYENLCAERDLIKVQNEIIGSNIYWLSNKISKFLSISVEILCVILLISTIFVATFVANPFAFNSKVITFIVICFFCLAVIFGLLNWYKGLSLKEVIKKFDKKFHKIIFRSLTNLLTNKLK